jgi:hypothetical protein
MIEPAIPSRGRVDAAGVLLATETVDGPKLQEGYATLNAWRALHSVPLAALYQTVYREARLVAPEPLVVQRLKRVESVIAKLQRFPQMKLSRMQDLGGCRAILTDVAESQRLMEAFVGREIRHTRVRQDDYVEQPKRDGYRGYHIVYRFNSTRNPEPSGLKIEVQIRSRLQHHWATAVEIVGTLLATSLKSNVGPEKWRRFFALAGSAFAHQEGRPSVPGTPDDYHELLRELYRLEEQLRAREFLRGASETLKVLRVAGRGEYYLLALDWQRDRLEVTPYNQDQFSRAQTEYLRIEKRFARRPGTVAVLVKASTLDSLREAYPNLYLDAEQFVGALTKSLTVRSRRRVAALVATPGPRRFGMSPRGVKYLVSDWIGREA